MTASPTDRYQTTLRAIVIGCALAGAGASAVAQETGVGKVLFATGDVRIVAPGGATRSAARGDLIGVGERLVTGDSGLGQVKMDDGGLVSLRPASGLLFEPTSGGRKVLALDSGDVRVLNLPASADGNPSAYLLRTPDGQVQMRRADVVAAVQPGDATTPAGPSLFQLNRGAGVAETAGGARQSLLPDQPVAISTASIEPADVAASNRLGSIKVPVDQGSANIAKDPSRGGTPLAGAVITRATVPVALRRPAVAASGPFKGVNVRSQLKGKVLPRVVRTEDKQTVRRVPTPRPVVKLPPLMFAAKKGGAPELRFNSSAVTNASRATTILGGVTRGGTRTKNTTLKVVPADGGSQRFKILRP